MILSGAPLSSLPFGVIPNDVDFVVTSLDFGADVDLNGRFAKELGLRIEGVPGWLNATTRQWSSMALVGRQGATKTATEAREQQLEMRIKGVVEGATIVQARARIDTIKALLLAKPVRVITPDTVTRFVVADVLSMVLEPYGPSFRQAKLPVEIVLVAPDPYAYDLVLTQVQGAAALRLPCELGTAPVRPVVTINGPAVNPVVTLRDWNGTVVAALTFGATTLIAGDVLVIDCAAASIAKNGVALMAALTAGDFLKLDPKAIADRELARWPTLETSAGYLIVRYARAWH